MEHRPIQLIVGLGNPGKEHELDRHNAGFWFVDLLAESFGARLREESKFNADLCLSLIHISEPTRPTATSRIPTSALK